MKNILILTAGFGDGHNAAAQNIREALERVSPEAEITVADLYERGYKRLNFLARKAYLGMVRYAPSLYAGFFKLVDRAPWLTESGAGMGRLRRSLAEALDATRPDCVVSTYPTYAQLIQTMFRDDCERPFRLVTVVTDAGGINSVWHRAPSDRFVVCDEPTAAGLARAGVPAANICPMGFPVSPRFAEPSADASRAPRPGELFRVLYVINTGKKKAGKAIDRLMEIPRLHLTVTVGRHAELKEKLAKIARRHDERLQVLGWTNQMPELLMRSHLVIGKAGGAAVQEALAARCPMIVNQIIPGQEEGNARLVEALEIGAIAEGRKEVARKVREAMTDGAALWRRWRARLDESSRPDASLRIARLVLEECERANRCVRPEAHPPSRRRNGNGHGNGSWEPRDSSKPNLLPANAGDRWDAGRTLRQPHAKRALLCDFHIHTNYSDGKLTVPEVVDFYGTRGFDCICITDHWTDPRRLIGKLARLTPYTLSYDQIEEYFEVIAREARRAMRRYGMLVMTGLEFNKDGPTRRSSAHLLGVDLKEPISPRLDLLDTIERIHAQGGLAVASHPHLMKSEWAKETLYLWEHQDRFAPVIDAWEIANRNNLFAPVSLKRFPFLANSDFHKPKHIYSWKTLLHCEKQLEAIKECIRSNDQVSITLYRDDHPATMAGAVEFQMPSLAQIGKPVALSETLPALAPVRATPALGAAQR